MRAEASAELSKVPTSAVGTGGKNTTLRNCWWNALCLRRTTSTPPLLVHLSKDPLFEITIPSKTQAYMAVGKPLLMALNGDAADLVLQLSGGVLAESENAEALAACAELLSTLAPDQLHALGQKAQSFYREHLALPVGVAKLGPIFSLLASNTVSK